VLTEYIPPSRAAEGADSTPRKNETNESIPGAESRFDRASGSIGLGRGPGQEPISGPDLIRTEASLYCMGTMFHIVAYGSRREQVELAIADAFGEARRLDGLLSNYRPESELSKVNRLAGQTPVSVSNELFQFLSACLTYSRASEGSFDVTVGPLVKVFGFYDGTGRPPKQDEILRALGKVGYRSLILDESNTTVRFAQQGMELDPGGIGKGLAVDKMAGILRRAEVYSALIFAGGSTIYALGAPPRHPGWKVTIKDPRKPSTTIETVELKDQAISTSGKYEKFFWSDGKILGHILDPRTGYPARGTLAVSVIAPQAIDSEAWAKPYYIQGRAWTEKQKARAFRVFFCEDKPSASCNWL
jgi:FAD:protein FMN transferase